MKKITLDDLLKNKRNLSYMDQYQYICSLMEAGNIRPIKSAGTNGKSPSLPLSYRIQEEKKDYSELIDELKYGISMQISTDYYMNHPEVYEKERKWVLQLSHYLENHYQDGSNNQDSSKHQDNSSQDSSNPRGSQNNNTKKEPYTISLNERSFQIWNREKFLQKEQGKKVLKHCGLTLDALNIYNTSEPLSYYSAGREVPQTILIIENKDTFYSMRKYLIDRMAESGEDPCLILGVPVRTLVYGAGKGILRSIEDFSFCVEPYMNHPDNQYLYFGDLDYEGIGIYEQLAELFQSEHTLIPFVEGYQKMLLKAEGCEELPDTKEGQNKNLSGHFKTFFKENDVKNTKKILEAGKYIPQEILNISDMG